MSKIFGENLRRLREQAGYKQAKEFAAVVGVPYTTYSSYEKLGREPRYEVLCKIAAALNVSTDELLGYELNKYDYYKMLAEFAGYSVLETQRGISVSDSEDKLIIQNPDNTTTLCDEFENITSFLNNVFPLTSRKFFTAELIYADKEKFVHDVKEAYRRYRENTKDQLYSEMLIQFRKTLLPAVILTHLSLYEKQEQAPPEDKATNRPPASQGRPESGHPGDEVAKSHPVEGESLKQGVTESPTPEAAPPKQEAPKPRRKRQKKSAPSKNETPSK